MRALIFGGSGFVGSHLTTWLVKRNVRVCIADYRLPQQAASDVEYISCDVRKPIADQLRITPADIVYNLAAIHRTPGHRDHEYYDTNVGGAINVTNWCSKQGIERLCFTSSIAVYGGGEEAKSDDFPPAPTTAYGKSKSLAEEIHRSWLAQNDDRQLIIVRPAVIFGPGENGNFTRLAQALSRRRFIYPGRSDVIKACGSIHDLLRAIDFFVSRDQREATFNFCYPRDYTIKEICEAFHAVAGYDRPISLPKRTVPALLMLLRIVHLPGESAIAASRVEKLIVPTKIIPSQLSHLGFDWQTTLESALHDWWMAEPRRLFE